MNTPSVCVGIMHTHHLHFTFHGTFVSQEGIPTEGRQDAILEDGLIRWNGRLYTELAFTPGMPGNSFSLHGVTIGVQFHWERQETQTFRGELRLITANGELIAINRLPVEDYLISVISSEMKATSSLEFLKAHAVISRSWLLAQMERRKHPDVQERPAFTRTDDIRICWYDREDHTLFDVCADDHCQRYQGITRADNPAVTEAVHATAGQVLTCDGNICDARFSKCCGGISEHFSACWDDREYAYLQPVRDCMGNPVLPDLTREEEAERWIRSTPEAFCHTTDRRILSQILNTYDRETTDFYRWKVHYTQDELVALLRERGGIDLGHILDLQPLRRGASGRIILLRILGTKGCFTLGKELEIRRALSRSHLFSSAFIVDKDKADEHGIPAGFTLTGAGWGHGVGLCQIGAAVMGERGYTYDRILTHYYPDTRIETRYE